MTSELGKTSAVSIRAKLLALAQTSGEDYQRVLGRFAIERFLYRLGNSPHRDRFVLKGATLFTLWTGKSHRPTKDLDLLGSGSSATDDVEQSVRAICEIEDDDGISFDGQSVEGVRIQEDDEYDGVRVKFRARLAGARIPMQVDIGFGDAVYPEPSFAEFPVLLAMSAPVIRAYPREASIAEKLHAMVDLDIRNSRMKDFYDIWFMATTWDFEQRLLILALCQKYEATISSALSLSVTTSMMNLNALNWFSLPETKCHEIASWNFGDIPAWRKAQTVVSRAMEN